MNIAEGFHRFRRREFIRFLEIALASLGESVNWLHDGIERGHFAPSACQGAFVLARGCRTLIIGLIKSLKSRPT